MIIQTIHSYELDEYTDSLIVEFSTVEDEGEFFRKDEIEKGILMLYLPPHFVSFKKDLDDEVLIEVLNEYYSTNPLPEPQFL